MKQGMIRRQAAGLQTALAALDPETLEASDYFKGYLRSYQDDLEAIVQRYVRILTRSTRRHSTTAFSFLDYGGGTGILSLLAKQCGIETVVYLDISAEATAGARALAGALNIAVDDFVTGTTPGLEQKIPTRFDVIANYDVLEHVYDPFETFVELSRLLNPGGSIYMASGANTYHPVINLLMRKKHTISEREGTVHGKEMDAKAPLCTIRGKMIRDASPDLSVTTVRALAGRTRGLTKPDILCAVHAYSDYGILPEPPDSTNTCDPITGNWDEHLIPYFALARRLRARFEQVKLFPGFYPEVAPRFIVSPGIKDDNIIKRLYPYLSYFSKLAAPLLNRLIRHLPGRIPFCLAPYYIIEARAPVTAQPQFTSDVARIYDDWDAWRETVKPIDTEVPYTPSVSAKYVADFLAVHHEIDTILDAGCGNGNTVLALNQMGRHVDGCDISKQAEGVIDSFQKASVTELPYADNSYDFIYSLSVLHHLEDMEEGIREIRRTLKPGGCFIATFHTRLSPYYLESMLKQRLNPRRYRHYEYITFSSVGEIIALFRKQGFHLVSYDGIHPFWGLTQVIYLLEYLRRRTGWKTNPARRLEAALSRLLPRRLRAEIGYHSVFTFRLRK
ncbi:MAG: methyltransferase domain-containing protein [Candidatus Cloacimonetes bacterium]|nr:methyltransferase domain-containing protein [Candidatus Cloacimonadota bacterium]